MRRWAPASSWPPPRTLSIRSLGQFNEPTWRTVFYFSLLATILTFPWWSELPAGQAWIGMALIVASGLATTLRSSGGR